MVHRPAKRGPWMPEGLVDTFGPIIESLLLMLLWLLYVDIRAYDSQIKGC